MKKSKIAIGLLTLLLAASFLAGCSSSKTSSATATDTTTAQNTPDTTVGATTKG